MDHIRFAPEIFPIFWRKRKLEVKKRTHEWPLFVHSYREIRFASALTSMLILIVRPIKGFPEYNNLVRVATFQLYDNERC